MTKEEWKNFFNTHWVKFAIFLSLFSAVCFMAGFAWRFYTPKIKTWALIEIEELSQKHLPVRIWPRKVDVQLFPLGLTFEDIHILPKGSLKAQLAPSRVKRLNFHLSLWALLQGRLHLAEVIIHKPQLKLVYKENIFAKEKLAQKSLEAPKDLPFHEILEAPFDALVIEDLDLMVGVQQQEAAAWIQNLNLTIENRFEALLFDLSAPSVILKNVAVDELVSLRLETRVLAEENRVQVSSFSLKKDKSWLIATGQLDGNLPKVQIKKQHYELRSDIKLDELQSYMSVFAPQWKLPPLQGKSQLDLEIDLVEGKDPRLAFKTEIKDSSVQGYETGFIKAEGILNQSELSIKDASVENRSGRVDLADLHMRFGDKISFQTKAHVRALEVRTFLESIKLPTTPLHLDVTGELPCQGEIYPDVKVQCKGHASGRNLWVHSGGDDKKTIVKLKQFEAIGGLDVSNSGVSYKVDLKAGEKSTGSSEGHISYSEGFDISYQANKVYMSDVEDLSGLDINGQAQIKGKTKGTSRYGTIDMHVNAENLWLEDYGLGRGEFDIKYKDGTLRFPNIQGTYQTSRYSGDLSLNLRKGELYLTAKSPYLDLEDLQGLFARKVQLPISISGTGSGDIKAWGPLQFSQLSYQLNSSFYRGTVAKETFDELIFNVTSKDGHVKSKRVQLIKGSSQIDLNGQVWPDGKIDTAVVGRNFRLEESEHLNRLGLNFSGQLDFTMSLTDHLPVPRTELNGRLSNMNIGGQPADDSKFRLNFTRDGVEGSGQFIGKVVETRFHLPFHDKAPFDFHLKTRKWNFAQIFSMFYDASRNNEFDTVLSASIDLKSPQGGFWHSTGDIKVDEFEVRRGSLTLAAPKPMRIHFNDGTFTTHNWYLEGRNSFLRFTAKEASRDNLKAGLSGKLNMSLLSLLTPFLSELRGQLSLSMNFDGTVLSPQILGSAYVEDGYVKLKEFPHAFEDLRADILFNRKNILLNSVKGRLAGGQLSADGRVRIVDIDNIPIDIKGRFEDVSLNIPENIRTKGSGTIYLKGPRFPYILGGSYDVTYGDVSKEFVGETSSSSRQIQPSTFLPKFLSNENFQPITLDLDIRLKNPIMVKNSMIEAPVKGNLNVHGLPQTPRLTGNLSVIDEGQINFRGNEFEVLTANLEWADAPPEKPTIYLSAQTRVTEYAQDTDGVIYDISLIAQGSAQDPQLTLSSQPVLSEPEIISLLALGLTSSELDKRNNLDTQATQSSIQIGSALLQKPLSKEIKNRLGMDFQLSSSYNDSENASVPKVTLSKQWTPKFGASASRTLEKSPTNNVKLEYRINQNISVIGRWEGKEETQIDEEKDTSQSRMGLDLEYKIEFK